MRWSNPVGRVLGCGGKKKKMVCVFSSLFFFFFINQGRAERGRGETATPGGCENKRRRRKPEEACNLSAVICSLRERGGRGRGGM